MILYDIGIEFHIEKNIECASISMGQVNCILRKSLNPKTISANKSTYSFRLALESPDIENAIECIELICAAKSIIDSVIQIDKDKFVSNIYVQECKRLDIQSYIEHRGNTIEVSVPDIGWYWAILIAEKAMKNIHSKIAALKYYNARIIYDIHPMELHPNNLIDRPYSSLLDKLRFAYSIIDLNSIIEELGIEIRANSKNPSVLNDAWNDTVSNDLETRLEQAKINPNKLITWLSRKESKRPFKANVIDSTNICSWSDCDQIFDFHISIKDAILELDYQRDRIASHCVGGRVCVCQSKSAAFVVEKVQHQYQHQNLKYTDE